MKNKNSNKTVNIKLNIIVIMLVILSLQLGFLGRQIKYTQNSIITHDRINIEALACVEDPYCHINPNQD